MLSNFPALQTYEVAGALIETVIPALAEAIDNAASDYAADRFGNEMSAFDIERISNDMLFSLVDFLILTPVPRRGVADMLRIHQLQNVAYAADYYGVSLHDIDLESDKLSDLKTANFADIESSTIVETPYSPALVTPPAEPVLVVDNRLGSQSEHPTRTLEQIKAEVDSRRRPTINFVQHDPKADERRIVIERAALAYQREEDQQIEEGIKRESQRYDAKSEGDLKPKGKLLPLKEGKPDTPLWKARQRTCANERCRKKFMPNISTQKYCSDTCRTTTWRRQFGRSKSKPVSSEAKQKDKKQPLQSQFY